ncbi:MAG: HlyD family efflux transporter periplasmic adaptor subunit [Bacteroidia bacterium]|nr:HlyD family efflux transporter periplasmic adaptor subunit [Bacteroidia bacterium]
MNLKNAESQLKHLAKQISLSRLEAPFAGTITYKDVEKGSVVGGAAVARITDLSKLKLEITIPEKKLRSSSSATISQSAPTCMPAK